ncbi:N-acetylmuramoyl-L-alanine amidase [Natranaerobius trueperi]|uniref:N-acetylmuramoyl-L-alanine amidase n=1 Tax=Natranaerobius trueperi TaxID=759412 RepID=UPI0013034B2B|nr:N-acetylmuramoyl-L-alanine amidase [Natranaerobius trueperi]
MYNLKRVTLLIIVLLVSFSATLLAQDDIEVKVDGEVVSFLDQEPYIDDNGRTQIPVRFVSEELGAYVEWNSDDQIVELDNGSDEIVLEIGKDNFTLNGKEKSMDTAPILTDKARVMVPLRFVSEGLGAYVDWKSEKYLVDITTLDNEDNSDNETDNEDNSDNETDNEDNSNEDEDKPNKDKLVEITHDNLNVRSGPSTDYDQVHQVHSGERYEFVKEFFNEDEVEYTDWVKINLESQDEDKGWVSKDFVEIHKLDDSSDEQDDPEEIPNEFVGPMGNITIAYDNLNVRKGPSLDYDTLTQVHKDEQYPLLTRSTKSNHPEYNEWYKIKIDEDTKGWVAADYTADVSYDDEYELQAINYVHWEQNDNNTTIGLGPIERTDVKSYTLDDPDRLVIDLDGISLNTDENNWNIGSKTIAQVRAREDDDTLRIVIDLNEKEHYSLSWQDSQLMVSVYAFSPLKDKKVVLDAGHGGSNTGAIGPTGLKEKEVALDVTLMTKELLTELGADVFLTRDRDITMTLDERVELTNNSDGDIFISVHANGHPNNNIHGTETFYSSERSSRDIELARDLQTGMLNTLNRLDRGVKDSRFRVLRKATIPAALVELAFLTNAEEEQLLRQDSFREDAAEGIVEGILNYFKNNY